MQTLLGLILAAFIILSNAEANERTEYEKAGLLLGLTIFLGVCFYLFICFFWLIVLGDAAFTPLGLFFAFIGWPLIIVATPYLEKASKRIKLRQAEREYKRMLATRKKISRTKLRQAEREYKRRFGIKTSLSDPELPHKVLWKKYNEFLDSVDEWGYNNKWSVFAIAGLTILTILFILYFSGFSFQDFNTILQSMSQ